MDIQKYGPSFSIFYTDLVHALFSDIWAVEKANADTDH